MATRKQAAKPPIGAARWHTSDSSDDLGPAEQIAHDILAGRSDLLPSVDRIMTAGLGTEGTLKAIGLFRDSLNNPGDVNRDPRVAIAEVASGLEPGSLEPSDG
jgi:hypothetical protein